MLRFTSMVLGLSLFCIVVYDCNLCSGQEPATEPETTPNAPVLGKLPNYPLDIAVHSDGTAFVVDRNMHGVWKWFGATLETFFEGSAKFRTPLNSPRCIVLDKDGTLLVGDTSTRDIYRVTAGGKAEPITNGAIGIPMDLAVKSDGTIYVADLELRTLFRIPPGESKPVEVAQVNPRGVFVDGTDRVWVVSQDAAQLQIVSDSGETEKVVDHRVFDFPHQVVVDATGTAFVTDGYKKAIWKVEPGSAPTILFEGAPLMNPVGITLVEGKLVVVDPHARTIFRFNADNKPEAWFEIK
jgi:streptogramin lyase